jgi:putative phosphoribosyl transferase
MYAHVNVWRLNDAGATWDDTAARLPTVILVDDGLATGASMRAAVAALRARGPAQIVAAAPTAAPQACEDFRHEVDEVVCLDMPAAFLAVGERYEDFSETSDEEVRALLAEARVATAR